MTDKDEIIVPAKFQTIIRDFTKDLTNTFPEYSILWKKWAEEDVSSKDIEKLFKYCTQVYPERFFDILYQNAEMFDDNKTNTCFLPHVQFSELWKLNISETTRQTIWKYLQLILFQVVGGLSSQTEFGETANIFQGVNEDELQEKIRETLDGLKDFFTTGGSVGADATKPAAAAAEGEQPPHPFAGLFGNLDSDNLQEHLKRLMGGKIGALVEEIMGELKDEFAGFEKDLEGLEPSGASMQKVMKILMKNPAKIMGIMKKMADKVKTSMQGQDQAEFMRETSSLFKEMGGREGFMQMFEQMKRSMPGGGKNMKINETALRKMEEQEKRREKVQRDLERKRAAKIEKMAEGNRVFRVEGEAAPVKTTKEDIDRLMKQYGLEDDAPAAGVAAAPSTKKAKKSGKKKA